MPDTAINTRVQKRLREEESAWITTVRRDGQPQPVPVWFLWDGESFLIYSPPDRQKLRNISGNPRVALNLNSSRYGADVVRVEGEAEILEDFPPATGVPEYLEKYREGIARIGLDPEGFARSYSVPVRVRPRRWQTW